MRRNKKAKLESIELSGQLTARSHILNTNPESVLLEICTKDLVQYIIIDGVKFGRVTGVLSIGRYYKFSNLSTNAIRIKSNTFQCLKAHQNTTWQEIIMKEEIYQPSFLEDFTNLRGRVTRSNETFGVIYLNGSLPVIMSTCSRIARIPMPKEGHKVIIYNVHRLNLEDSQVIYAMCVKSYVSIENEEETPLSPFNLSPLLLSLGGALRNYKLILCLQDCFLTLQRSLNDDFLSSNGIPLSECADFRSLLLQNIAKVILERSNVCERSTLGEFMTADHNLNCGTLVEEVFPFSLVSLLEIDKEYPPLDTDADLFWQYDVKKEPKTFLVGIIAVKTASHRLTLNDSFGSAQLLVMPQQNQVLAEPGLFCMTPNIVLVDRYDTIREVFSLSEKDQQCSTKSLAVYMNNILQISSQPTSIASQNSIKISGRVPPLKQYHSHYIAVQHKSSICVPKQGTHARSYLLATLVPQYPDANYDIFICLEKSLLSFYPYISVNNVYEVRFPLGSDVDFFKKGFPLSFLIGMQSLLPTISCVTLPGSCEIHPGTDHSIPMDKLKFGGCYRIAQILKNVQARTLINVVGYVTGRYHQEPRFQRETISVNANGFGIPGTKMVAIILCDTPLEGQLEEPVTLYLSYWNTLQYPIGLLPGAKVIFRFVTKVIGPDGSKYLRSTILTSVQVLDLESSELSSDGQCTRVVWGPRGLLQSALKEEVKRCQWMSVSMIHLRKVSITAVCSTCNHQFQNGGCTNSDCGATSFIVLSQAFFEIHEFESSPAVKVFVPNSLVRNLFQSSDKTWERIETMAQTFGSLSWDQSDHLDVSQLPLELRLFRSFCRIIPTGSRFHMLCRQFYRNEDSETNLGVPSLYAVYIKPVTMLMAAS